MIPLVRSDRLSARLFASLEEVRERRGDELADVSLFRGVSPTQTLSTVGRLLPAVGWSILAIGRGLVSGSYEEVPREVASGRIDSQTE